MQKDHYPTLLSFINTKRYFYNAELRELLNCTNDTAQKSEEYRAIVSLIDLLKRNDAITIVERKREKGTKYKRLKKVSLRDTKVGNEF